jgi:alpha-tubulin suppressor-like RCC1 family protein
VTRGGLDDECISHVSCGARHTLAITEDGEAFSWGLGHYGVLGRSFTPYDHDPETAVAQMVVDEEDANPTLLGAAAAAAPEAVQNPGPAEGVQNGGNGEQGTPWSFENLMEHLNMVANLSLTDSSDQCIPKIVDSMVGIKIVGVSAGHRHSLFLDERGSLYSCGAGISGCLGHGDNGSHMVPMKVNAFGKCTGHYTGSIAILEILTT